MSCVRENPPESTGVSISGKERFGHSIDQLKVYKAI